MVTEIEACAGTTQSGEQGTLNSAGTLCTYASGRTITFNVPLVVGTDQQSRDFTLTVGGQQCLHYVETSDGSMTITGPSGKVLHEVASSQSGSATLSCPDGSTYQGDATSIMSCLDAAFGGGLPGISTSESTNSSELGLLGDGTIYSCQTSP